MIIPCHTGPYPYEMCPVLIEKELLSHFVSTYFACFVAHFQIILRYKASLNTLNGTHNNYIKSLKQKKNEISKEKEKNEPKDKLEERKNEGGGEIGENVALYIFGQPNPLATTMATAPPSSLHLINKITLTVKSRWKHQFSSYFQN